MRNSLIYGTITGLLLALLGLSSALAQVLEVDSTYLILIQLGALVVTALGVLIGMFMFRRSYADEYSFGPAFFSGMNIAVASAVIGSLLTWFICSTYSESVCAWYIEDVIQQPLESYPMFTELAETYWPLSAFAQGFITMISGMFTAVIGAFVLRTAKQKGG